ncbi:hypothetical protein GOB94_00895 [Granulicella sp. 5B5]|uniref:hypothetical protein n=1 Tax=Granulicella sp. 5B5 TaxID=1617967 RepID=UPI0015F4E160|nr:hypothetical protein [Granulicella sp. 5B5]QMV17427.1 hypothetical protein GOB94_00895 [Granulicella sp. 5B5]
MIQRRACITAVLALTLFAAITAAAQHPKPAYKQPTPVPTTEPSGATESTFVDKHDKVRFTVPRGWELSRKDGEVSTFHLDARSAPPTAQLRGIAMLDFNPFPYSTLAGALFYFSIEPHTTDAECAAQANFPAGPTPDPSDTAPASTPVTSSTDPNIRKDVQDIAGMPFTHGHDEHGRICIEARDEVYTAWHKHSCYRFDLAMNTFCSESSGAQPISTQQILSIDQRMTNILATVTFGWQKTPAHPISAPDVPEEQHRKKSLPRVPSPATT